MRTHAGWFRIVGAILLGLPLTSIAADTYNVGVVIREAVEARLRDYGGKNAEREAKLKQMFVDSDCSEHLSEQHVKFSRVPNLICVLPGTSNRVIIVGAHFDRVSTSEGVADNWSGASLLPSLYEAVKVEPRQHTYLFIGFTDEEQGLVGSRFYAHQMTPEQVAATDAMINLDTLGLAPTEVWSHRSDKRLQLALLGVANFLKLPLNGVNFENVGSTDSEPLRKLKIPSMTVHSLTQKSENEGILHTSKDRLASMNLDYYYDTYKLLAVYLVWIDHYFDKPAVSEPATSTSGP